jgi:hypothetical protein
MRLLVSWVPCLLTTALLGCDGKAPPSTQSQGDASVISSSGGTTTMSEADASTNSGSMGSAGEADINYADRVFDAGPTNLADSGTITFTIHNDTGVPLSLPGGLAGRWLEIGYSGYSLWPANSVTDGTLCDADPDELGELPPPAGEIPVGGEFSFDWKANAFRGAKPVPGMSEDYFCAATSSVPIGEHQFLICARQGDVHCYTDAIESYPPRLICASTMAHVGLGHTHADFTFGDASFPTENCPQAEEASN